MDVKIIMDLLEVKERQALAFCHVYKEKLSYDDLQSAIDCYCNNMADSLIQRCTPLIYEEKFRNDLKRQLHNLGADKQHSGKRAHEAFYKKIIVLESKMDLLK